MYCFIADEIIFVTNVTFTIVKERFINNKVMLIIKLGRKTYEK